MSYEKILYDALNNCAAILNDATVMLITYEQKESMMINFLHNARCALNATYYINVETNPELAATMEYNAYIANINLLLSCPYNNELLCTPYFEAFYNTALDLNCDLLTMYYALNNTPIYLPSPYVFATPVVLYQYTVPTENINKQSDTLLLSTAENNSNESQQISDKCIQGNMPVEQSILATSMLKDEATEAKSAIIEAPDNASTLEKSGDEFISTKSKHRKKYHNKKTQVNHKNNSVDLDNDYQSSSNLLDQCIIPTEIEDDYTPSILFDDDEEIKLPDISDEINDIKAADNLTVILNQLDYVEYNQMYLPASPEDREILEGRLVDHFSKSIDDLQKLKVERFFLFANITRKACLELLNIPDLHDYIFNSLWSKINSLHVNDQYLEKKVFNTEDFWQQLSLEARNRSANAKLTMDNLFKDLANKLESKKNKKHHNKHKNIDLDDYLLALNSFNGNRQTALMLAIKYKIKLDLILKIIEFNELIMLVQDLPDNKNVFHYILSSVTEHSATILLALLEKLSNFHDQYKLKTHNFNSIQVPHHILMLRNALYDSELHLNQHTREIARLTISANEKDHKIFTRIPVYINQIEICRNIDQTLYWKILTKYIKLLETNNISLLRNDDPQHNQLLVKYCKNIRNSFAEMVIHKCHVFFKHYIRRYDNEQHKARDEEPYSLMKIMAINNHVKMYKYLHENGIIRIEEDHFLTALYYAQNGNFDLVDYIYKQSCISDKLKAPLLVTTFARELPVNIENINLFKWARENKLIYTMPIPLQSNISKAITILESLLKNVNDENFKSTYGCINELLLLPKNKWDDLYYYTSDINDLLNNSSLSHSSKISLRELFTNNGLHLHNISNSRCRCSIL